jgi:peptide/nickel transport system permease protein
LGLDKPLYEQFAEYMLGLPRLDLGKSLWTGEPVIKEIVLRMPVSFQIALMAGIIAVLIAIPLGTISALYRDTWIDHTVRVVAVSGLAIPSFWLGMLIILGLLSLFNWLPKIGYVPLWEDPIANLSVTIWPAASVGYRYAAVATRMMRSSLLEVMREDYIRTARAKGVWTRLIMRRHALRNALLPVVTVIGLEFAFLIGGLVVTEQVFNINGIGKLFVDATARGDFNLIQGLVLLIATIFVLVNLLVDLIYGWLDPRIRLR